MWQKADRIALLVFLVVLTGIFGWGAYELHVDNIERYLSPDEKVHAREMAFHRELGELRGEIKGYQTEVEVLKTNLPDYMKQIGETSGRVDAMQAYFDKYSPEIFEKNVRDLRMDFETFQRTANKEKLIADVTTQFDTRYVQKYVIDNMKHLPTSYEWKQHLDKVAQLETAVTALRQSQDKITRLEAETAKLKKQLLEAAGVPELPESERTAPETEPVLPPTPGDIPE